MSDRKYIPSEDMGDYEEYKKKKGPKKSGPLYPLNEEVLSILHWFKLHFPHRAPTELPQRLCPSRCPATRRERGSQKCTRATQCPATATCTGTLSTTSWFATSRVEDKPCDAGPLQLLHVGRARCQEARGCVDLPLHLAGV